MSKAVRVWAGVALWAGVCVMGVLLRGVGWEESLERAQVLLGVTPYPDGHPLKLWAFNSFSVHYFGSALLLWLTDAPGLICGLRQILAAMATHIPVFLLVTVLTGRSRWGHVAALLSMAGCPVFFQSYMPMGAWTDKATSGQIGLGYALLVLTAMSAARWRTAALMLGLMPLVHIGQMPPVLATAVLCGIVLFGRGDRPALYRALPWGLAGLAVTAIAWCIHRTVMLPLPQSGGYFSPAGPWPIWAHYVTHEDMHRALTAWPRFGPFGHSVIAMAGVVIIGAALAKAESLRRQVTRPATVVLVYGAVCCAIVLGVMLVQWFLRERSPYALLVWIPYRLTIHLGILALCLAVASLANADTPRRAQWVGLLVLGGLAWLAARPVLALILPPAVQARYVAPPETVLFALGGAGLMLCWVALSAAPVFRRAWFAAALALCGGLALYHQLAALCLLAGGIVFALLDRVPFQLPGRDRALPAGALLGAALMCGLLYPQWRNRDPLPVSAFEREVADYLEAAGVDDAMLVTPLDEDLQMRIEHPMFATFELRQHQAYMPSLAPTIAKMYREVYGVTEKSWYDWEQWRNRSTGEWQRLATRYGFRYVLSPTFYPLHLTPVLEGEGRVLYRVPEP